MGTEFNVNNSGNITLINSIPYSWPGSQGSPVSILTNDGSGNLTWGIAGGGSQWSNGVGGVIYYNGGSVGIGTSTPAVKLDVAGFINVAGILFHGSTFISTEYDGSNYSNSFIGGLSGANWSSGTNNSFFGYNAGFNDTTGNGNTYVGANAGFNNHTGSGNVFIGVDAGQGEGGSNKLYIANSPTPIIYGDFSSGFIGLGTTSPSYIVDAVGDINISGIYRIGGSQIASTDLFDVANLITTGTLLGGDLTGTLPNPTVTNLTNTSTTVNISNSSAPTAGNVLTATDSTHATWQTPSGDTTARLLAILF